MRDRRDGLDTGRAAETIPAARGGIGMFEKALAENREAIYAILSPASLPPEAATPSGGTAFMIAPGLLVTAARCVPGGSDPGNLPRPGLSLVRAPDIGRGTERATAGLPGPREGARPPADRCPAIRRFLPASRRPRPGRHALRVSRLSPPLHGSRPRARRLPHRDVPGGERLLLREERPARAANPYPVTRRTPPSSATPPAVPASSRRARSSACSTARRAIPGPPFPPGCRRWTSSRSPWTTASRSRREHRCGFRRCRRI